MTQQWTAHLRRAALWAVPGALLAALVWTLLPHGGGGGEVFTPASPPALPGQTRAATDAAAPPSTPASGAPAATPPAAAPPRSPAAPAAAVPPRVAQAAGTSHSSGAVAAGEIKLGNLVGTDEKGHTRWQIVADDMLLQQPQQLVILTRVRATLFNADGTRMLIDGARGTYDTATREIVVRGDVHGVASNGRELFADTVSYLPAAREVEGQGHVRVLQERVIMYADRMISDLRLGQTRFFGNVHMTLR